ncbi:MAG: type I restriction enzyme HsdR N-terminal domain-containing protein [Flavobacteriaceae bacterium]|nr:type I restriction enzyme HsdR N-terminal domain-containing protein [Flavobacteriaceae bacterium]
MSKLNFPDYEFKIKNIDNKTYIFDIVRKKFFILNPEEWVRQHVICYLLEKEISKNHIGIEKKVIVNKMNKRFDIVVYNRDGSVKLLVECKAPNVKIDQAVFDQTLIYNKSLNSQFMMITNGLIHFFFKIDYKTKKYKFIKEFPFS